MKKLFAGVMIVGLMFSPLVVRAEEMAGMNHEGTETQEVANKMCPVSGEKIGEMGKAVDVEYNGKKYHLCCSMCQKDFNKDPEKFSKVADDEVAATTVQQ